MSQHWLKPNWEPLLSIPEMPIKYLIERNIKALILDADKTLIDSKENIPHLSVKQWIENAKLEFKIHVLSNNPSKERISRIAEHLNLPYTYLAAKPRRISVTRVIKQMQIQREEIAIIGDRIFTDILVGNRLGLYTVLVKPLGPNGKREKNPRMQKIEKNIAHFLGARY